MPIGHDHVSVSVPYSHDLDSEIEGVENTIKKIMYNGLGEGEDAAGDL